MFEEQAVVSAKGDVYSFGMTILQVRQNLLRCLLDHSILLSCLPTRNHTLISTKLFKCILRSRNRTRCPTARRTSLSLNVG